MLVTSCECMTWRMARLYGTDSPVPLGHEGTQSRNGMLGSLVVGSLSKIAWSLDHMAHFILNSSIHRSIIT